MSFDFRGCKIAVIGDVMLDTYIEGSVARLSPEAPVPVVHFRNERLVPGGGANVAANIAALGGAVRLIAVIGGDGDAERLKSLLLAHDLVDIDSLVVAADRPTTVKIRVIGEHQQIVRIDRETTKPLEPALIRAVIERCLEAIAWADVLVLSDYSKGLLSTEVLRAVIDAARLAGKKTIVDPKRADVAVYAGADFITPNRAELTRATNLPCDTDEEAERAAAALIAETGSGVILTRSAQGISYFQAGLPPQHLPTFARAVFDVAGAGDTVVATLALAIAAKLPIGEAMRLANHAAGIVVAKFGTAVVSHEELREEIQRERHPNLPQKGALVSLKAAAEIRESWRALGLKVGFTNGCFDLLHPGHISLLEQAAAESDRLIVALNTDDSVTRLKGPSRPIQNEIARARVIGALGAVDLVVLFDEDTPLRTITTLLPDVLVKGADYTVETVVGANEVLAAGGHVILASLVAGQSTSNLISRSRTPE